MFATIIVYIHHFLWFALIMPGLKSFLYGVAPLLGSTGGALYERQRALVNLGVLESVKGRGPGSGVPLSPFNIGAVIISLLAAESLTEVDDRVTSLINAPPETLSRSSWEQAGRPTFGTTVAAVLSGMPLPWPLDPRRPVRSIRVSRCWRGQVVRSPSGANPKNYVVDGAGNEEAFRTIQITAEIEQDALDRLCAFTQGALSQAFEEDDE